jgi:hypothetical protein
MADKDTTEFSFPDETKESSEEKPEIEVVIVDDTPEVDRGREPLKTPPKELTDDELNKYDESVKTRIKHFSKGYHDERRAKEAAVREQEEAFKIARALVEENKRLRGSLGEGQEALIGQAKRVVASEYEEAKRKYKEAAEAFDTDAQMAAQEEMMAVRIRADKLENFKPAPLQPSEFEVQTEQRANKPQLDDRLTSWQEKNKWFGENKRMTAYALGLHEDILAEGVPAGSDKYYEKLDTDLKQRFPDQFDVSDVDAKPRKTKSNVVAPATRSTAARKVVLTQSQVNTAKRLGVSLELYARKVAELEGR